MLQNAKTQKPIKLHFILNGKRIEVEGQATDTVEMLVKKQWRQSAQTILENFYFEFRNVVLDPKQPIKSSGITEIAPTWRNIWLRGRLRGGEMKDRSQRRAY